MWSSFFLSWLVVVFATHAALPGGTYTPTAASLTESVYHFIPLGIPFEIVLPLLMATSLAYLASLATCCSGSLGGRARARARPPITSGP